MNPADITAAIATLEYDQVDQIRAAVEARMQTLREQTIERAKAMGLTCADQNGKAIRKRRTANAQKDAD